eukprot:gene19895-21838_t
MSWQRFDEFKAVKVDAEVKKQLGKRKSLDVVSHKAQKKRRRSLCFSYAASYIADTKDQGHRGGGKEASSEGLNNDEIKDFSSSEDEEKPYIGGQLIKKEFEDITSYDGGESCQPKKYGSTSLYKKQTSTGVVAESSKSTGNIDLIDWSESEDESINSETLKLQSSFQNLRRNDLAEDNINDFDSPVKEKSQSSTQISITESSPSPKPTEKAVEIKVEIGNTVNDYLTKPLDSSKKKRKDVKGGLVSRLRKVISRENSEFVFWKHSNDCKSSRNEELPFENRKSLMLKVLNKDLVFSHLILHCQVLEDSLQTVYLLIPQLKSVKCDVGQQDTLLKVYKPWRKVDLLSVKAPVLVCVYYFEIVTDLSEIYRNDGNFDFEDANSIVNRDEKIPSLSEADFVDHLSKKTPEATTTLLRDFQCFPFWKESAFSAVIEGFFTTRHNTPFGSTELLQSRCSIAHIEVTILIKDLEDKFATVTLPLIAVKEALQGQLFLSELHKCIVTFQNVLLTSIKFAHSDPALFALIDQKIRKRKLLLGDTVQQQELNRCFVFSYGRNSSISFSPLHTQEKCNLRQEEAVTEAESSCQPETVKQLTESIRISLFAYSICTVQEKGRHLSECLIFIAASKSVPPVCSTKDSKLNTTSASIYSVQSLPSFYIPHFIQDNMKDDRLIYFEDLLIENSCKRQLVADKYSKIFFADSKDNIGTEAGVYFDCYKFIPSTTLHGVDHVTSRIFSGLSTNTPEGCLALVEGNIIGLDTDNALFWKICSVCQREPQGSQTKAFKFFCQNCSDYVESKVCVQLEVFLSNARLDDCFIHVKLLEETIFGYLPAKITEDFEGFDVNCILGQKFGPVPCLVKTITENHKQNKPEVEIFLEEVDLAKRFRELFKAIFIEGE